MINYDPGQRLRYSEDGAIFNVTVLENKSTGNERRYTLKIDEIIEPNPDFPNVKKVGDEFECAVSIPKRFAQWN